MTLSYVARPLHPSARFQSDRPAVIFAGSKSFSAVPRSATDQVQQDLCRRCPRFGQNDERRIGPRDEKNGCMVKPPEQPFGRTYRPHVVAYAAERLSVPSSAPA